MNTTLLRLVLSSVSHSPALAVSKKSSYHIVNSAFSRSFSHFFYSNTNCKLHIEKSHFSNFLDTAIKVDSKVYLSMLDFNHSTYVSNDTDVTISHCRFLHTRSANDGGAIYLSEDAAKTSVSNCLIVNCSSKKNGGGIFSRSPRFWVYSTGFVGCDCAKGHYSAAVYSNTPEIVSILFMSCVESPFHYPTPVENGVVHFVDGKINLQSANFSMNFGSMCGAMLYENTISSRIKFLNCYALISGYIMGFHNFNATMEHQMANIVNCSALNGIFHLQQARLIAEQFVFKYNNANITNADTKPEDSALLLYQCIFDEESIRTDFVNVITKYVLLNRPSRTTFEMRLLNTWGCESAPIEFPWKVIIFLVSVMIVMMIFVHIYSKNHPELKQD